MHVHFTAGGPGDARLLLDDVDITESVLVEGFKIQFEGENRRPTVFLRIRPERLTVEGDAVIDAARVELADRVAAATNPEQEDS